MYSNPVTALLEYYRAINNLTFKKIVILFLIHVIIRKEYKTEIKVLLLNKISLIWGNFQNF